MVQWLKLLLSSAGHAGSSLIRELRIRMSCDTGQLKKKRMDNNKCCQTAYGMEKNTANYISDKGLILTIYKELNSKKKEKKVP